MVISDSQLDERLGVLQDLGAVLYALGEALQIHSSSEIANRLISTDIPLVKHYASFALNHPLDYTWFTGHLSDIGCGLYFSSLAARISQDIISKTSQLAIPATPLALLTLYETVFDSRTDWQDILCYGLGAAVAQIVLHSSARTTSHNTLKSYDLESYVR